MTPKIRAMQQCLQLLAMTSEVSTQQRHHGMTTYFESIFYSLK
ncbi:hypothetical protein [Rickettsia endosymbiont of Polydrusus tereticollis]